MTAGQGQQQDSRPASRREEARGGNLRSLGRALSYTLPHWRRVVLAVLLMSVYAGATSLRVGMFGILLDGVILPRDAGQPPGKFVQFYDDHLASFFPFDLRVTESFSASYRGVLVEGVGTPSEPRQRGEQWTVNFDAARLSTLRSDNDNDGEPEERAGGDFRRVSVVFDAPPEVTPGVEAPFRFEGEFLLRTEEGEAAAPDELLEVIIGFACLGLALSLIVAASNFGREYLSRGVIFHSVVGLRTDLFRKLSSLSVGYFGRRQSGDLLSRITNDVNSVQLCFRYVFGELLQQPITVLAALTIAFYASWHLTLVVLVFLPFLFIPLLRSGKKVKRHGRGSLEKMGEVTQVISELVAGIRVIKAFRMEEAQWADFDRKNAGFVRSSLKMLRAKVTANSLMEGLYNLLSALLLAGGAYLLVGGWIPINFGDFAVFVGAVVSIYKPMKTMTKAYNTIQESLGGAERVFEILDEDATIRDRDDANAFQSFESSIDFDGVGFRYDAESPRVLCGIDLHVRRGETIALVGASGAGKSTLLDLVARFEDPTEGAIRIDGVDLRDGTHSSLLAQLAIVGQEPFLFHTTIADNIRFGRPGATQEEIEEAARAAAIHDDIVALPEGYDTVLGDRGHTLSGGQRQRLTIARAILKQAEILILDEATSALDSESEREVQRALENLMTGKTTFVIAHRLSTIRHADRILVMDAGQIVERGSHEELCEQGGTYARLLEMQQRANQLDGA